MIRHAQAKDAPYLAEIYNHYIQHTTVSFETEPLSPCEMQKRITLIQAKQLPWLVAEQQQKILGYAYARPWHERSAYQKSVETAIYLAPLSQGQGLGKKLYQALFESLKNRAHTAIAVIALPNEKSVALQEKLGLKKVGELKQVGYKFGQWIDIGHWQKLID